MTDCDVCVIGSGAGGGPVALTVSSAGHSVVVLEKGPWLKEGDFFKDEIGDCRRRRFTPHLKDEPHSIETANDDGSWSAESTLKSGWDFWNAVMVGGGTNLMSGFFLRMKPTDFALRSTFGPIEGADIQDWPISYDDMEPFYAKVEREVGISGRVISHPFQEPRSTPDFPFPPTAEHPLASWLDSAGQQAGVHPFPLPRAILSTPLGERGSCSYSGYCGNHGCSTGAKGSSRAALLNRAVATGNCEVRANSTAVKIITDSKGRAREVEYRNEKGEIRKISARIVVVACQPIETSRLLLLSTSDRFPYGLANNNRMVGKHLLFSAGSGAEGAFPYDHFSEEKIRELRSPQPFINRTVHDWYTIRDKDFGPPCKGGSMDFMFVHPNPISLARFFAFSNDDKLVWGTRLKNDLKRYINDARHVMVEVFSDWLPTSDCNVSLDPSLKDRWGVPVAKVRYKKHPRQREIAKYLAKRAGDVLKAIGAHEIEITGSGGPSTNLPAGSCRFGKDPKTSVLDPDCRAHEVENLFVTDGSFMPTGGSVPYTWTIYANSFRVAEKIVKQL